MKKNKPIYQKVLLYFCTLIIFPTLISWLAFEVYLNGKYVLENVNVQQSSLENYVRELDIMLENMNQNVVSILESNTEMTYYLKEFYSRTDMIYTLKKYLEPLCKSVYSTERYVKDINIYTDADVLYFEPFLDMKTIPLDSNTEKELRDSDFREVFWIVDEQENGMPEVRTYQKIYDNRYSECLGYLEINIDSQFFLNGLDSLKDIVSDEYVEFVCQYGQRTIYRTSEFNQIQEDENRESEMGGNVYWTKNRYVNVVMMKQCELKIYAYGKLSNFVFQKTDTISVLLIAIIVVFLLILYLIFFRIIYKLSEKIFVFSTFIKECSTENLSPYPYDKEQFSKEYAEIVILIQNYNTLVENNHHLIEQVMTMEVLSQEARYQALQSQIQPHFIYGTLETIRMLALANQDAEAATMIYALSTMIRSSISITSEASTVGRELKIVSSYLEIQKVRFSNRLLYKIDVDNNLSQLKLPAFTLQPIVENAIIHGITDTLESCEIIIRIFQENSKKIILVGNTGKLPNIDHIEEINSQFSEESLGPPPDTAYGQSNGIALRNIYKRLAFFYQDKVLFYLKVEGSYTYVIIEIKSE